MTTIKTINIEDSPPVRPVVLVSDTTAQGVLDLGTRRRWNVTVLGYAPMPTDIVHLGDWMIVPAHMDTAPLPKRAWQRVQAIYEAGLRPQGFVVVHETPQLLTSATHKRPRRPTTDDFRAALRGMTRSVALGATKAAPIVWQVAKAAGTVAWMSAKAVGYSTLIAIGLIAAVLVDPILIAVTNDDCWIEVDRWDTEV